MKHGFGFGQLQGVANHRRVAAVAQHRDAGDAREVTAQFGFGGEQGQLVDFDQGDFVRAMTRALPAQFRANRSTRTGDQHTQPAANGFPVGCVRLPSEQVFDCNFFEFTRKRAALQNVRQFRHHPERDIAVFA